jgi:hypothetical protein
MMSIKIIFWIVIFFIWIFSRILKKIPQKKGDSLKNKVQLIKENVGDIFKELSEKMKEAEQKTEKPITTIAEPKDGLPPPIPQGKINDLQNRFTVVPVKATVTVSETRVSESRFRLSPKDLRQAVILSEILAPPIALRNEEKVRSEELEMSDFAAWKRH